MKLATWNVNSLRVRLPQVLDWLEHSPVDFLCLQELKLAQDMFPLEAIEEAGYKAVWAGQRTYNGVAILSPHEGRDIQRNIPGYEDEQQRIVAATYDVDGHEVRVVSAYCPNGESPESDKYVYKLDWYKALNAWVADEMREHPNYAILGDYNIAPTDEDVYKPERWVGKNLVSQPERDALNELLALGLEDAFRLFEQEPASYTWWDYRLRAYARNAGLRIDHILLSEPMARACRACFIDKGPRENTQPSDHTPIIAEVVL